MALQANATAEQLLPIEQTPLLPSGEPYPALYVVETPFEQPYSATEPFLIDSDSIPELHTARQTAAVEAQGILSRNREKLFEGDFDRVHLPVEALGRSGHVVAVKRKYGVESPEYEEAFGGLVLDAERLIGEAIRAKTWEYFAPADQKRDPDTDKYMAHGIPVLDITERGISPIAEPEEQDRRLQDHVGEIINHVIPQVHALGRLGLRETVRSRHISECTDFAVEGYKKDSKASHGGYVPAIEKMMIDDIVFDKYGNRTQEQVGLSGLYITHDVIQTVLKKQGAIQPDQNLSKTEIHGKQFIDNGGGDLIDFVSALDEEASRASGKQIFMGEVVPDGQSNDYSTIKAEAEARRAKLAPKPLQLANHLMMLQENGTDRFVADALVDEFLTDMLLEVASNDPTVAEVIFDKATADGFAEAARLEASGNYERANEMRQEVKAEAPKVSYCGGGSGACGLEEVSNNSKDAALGKSLGLNRGKLLRDKERSCPKCETKNILYDVSTGNKACTNCHHRQIDGKTYAGRKKQTKQTDEPAPIISLAEKREDKSNKAKNQQPIQTKPPKN